MWPLSERKSARPRSNISKCHGIYLASHASPHRRIYHLLLMLLFLSLRCRYINVTSYRSLSCVSTGDERGILHRKRSIPSADEKGGVARWAARWRRQCCSLAALQQLGVKLLVPRAVQRAWRGGAGMGISLRLAARRACAEAVGENSGDEASSKYRVVLESCAWPLHNGAENRRFLPPMRVISHGGKRHCAEGGGFNLHVCA